MLIPLRKDTAGGFKIGPVVEQPDSVTPITSAIPAADLLISKGHNGTFSVRADTNNSTHLGDGWHYVQLAVGDVDTIGPLDLKYRKTTATISLHSWVRGWVFSQAYYDEHFANTSDPLASALSTLQAEHSSLSGEHTTLQGEHSSILSAISGIATGDLNDTAGNRQIIAKALKVEDMSSASAVDNSIYKDIKTPLDAIFAKLPSGLISGLDLGTIIDGMTLQHIFELTAAMVDGRILKDSPNVGDLTFYRRDNSTILTITRSTESERTRVVIP